MFRSGEGLDWVVVGVLDSVEAEGWEGVLPVAQPMVQLVALISEHRPPERRHLAEHAQPRRVG